MNRLEANRVKIAKYIEDRERRLLESQIEVKIGLPEGMICTCRSFKAGGPDIHCPFTKESEFIHFQEWKKQKGFDTISEELWG